MSLEGIINGIKKFSRAVVLGTALYMPFCGCGSSGDDKKKTNPLVTGPVITDTQGEAEVENTDGSHFGVIVKDEKTLDLLPDKTVYVIHGSEEVYVVDKDKNFISFFQIFKDSIDPSLDVLLSSLADRIDDGLSEYRTGFHHEEISWVEEPIKINETPVPLSGLEQFYSTYEDPLDSYALVLEVAGNYSVIGMFAKEAWELRQDLIESACPVAELLGINPDEIFYDIYREPTSGLLFHRRVDGIPVLNIKPTVEIDFIRGIKGGNIPITYLLSDVDGDNCDIIVEYSTDGTNFFPATSSGGDGITNLLADMDGEKYNFIWDSSTDEIALDTLPQKILFKITPNDGSSDGLEDGIHFGVDNNPQILLSNNEKDSGVVDLAIDSLDNPHVVFMQVESMINTNIIYTKNIGSWFPLGDISNNTTLSNSPRIVIDSNEIIHTIWLDASPSNYDVFYSKYDGSWSVPENISNSSTNSYHPCLTLDMNDFLHVAWMELGSPYQQIYYSKFSGSWSIPEDISSTPYNSNYPNIIPDLLGNLHVTWDENRSDKWDIFYSKYNGSWSVPENISNSEYGSGFNKMAMDSSNQLYVVWQAKMESEIESSPCDIFYSKYTGSWSVPENISNDNANTHGVPYIILKDNLPHVFWVGLTSESQDIYYSNYEGKWNFPKNITHNSGTSGEMVIKFDYSNEFHMVWSEKNSSTNFWEVYYKKMKP